MADAPAPAAAEHIRADLPVPLPPEPAEAEAEALDALRLGAVLRLTGGRTGPGAPLFVLEVVREPDGGRPLAGRLARCGLRVDLLHETAPEEDAPEKDAPGECPPEGGAPAGTGLPGAPDPGAAGTARVRRLTAPPAAWQTPWLYDLVLCGHTPGAGTPGTGHTADGADSGRRAAEPVTRLARLVRLTGSLLLPGTGPDDPAADACRALLEPLGMRYREFAPYGFPGTRTGFHVLTRSG
ncbi:hypothetical protein [Streptomyces sp. YIM 98790]|uniref:hypothetical protein n=1 Tax=Streptomyces sp. YIM 98790 TaxID=2689077 RepID=UPI00140D79F6|nr:hypothetical protein [Streptomyces sp. YIM 98790]